MILQYPIGWLSDRMDRRKLIAIVSALGVGACALGFVTNGGVSYMLVAAFFAGGCGDAFVFAVFGLHQ